MKSPMQAFVGVYFDCVVENSLSQGVVFYLDQDTLDLVTKQNGTLIPRLNKAQVLTDYTPILIDGFVWDMAILGGVTGPCSSAEVIEAWIHRSLTSLQWITFNGVEKGSEWEAWAIANDVPVIDKTNN